MGSNPMTTTTTHTNGQQLAEPAHPDFCAVELATSPHAALWSRLIQEHHRLHFLLERTSLVGEWAEEAINLLQTAFPTIIKRLEKALEKGIRALSRQ
ncbi:MAG: type IV toxin-antitoxin system YeeU family antitoxin [Aeromonas veronii]